MAKLSPIEEEDNWFQGETKLFEFTVNKADDSGPEIITGWAIEWRVFQHAKAQDTLLVETGADVTITDGPNGLVRVTVAAADTIEIEPSIYWHELWRTDVNNEAVLSYGPAVLR